MKKFIFEILALALSVASFIVVIEWCYKDYQSPIESGFEHYENSKHDVTDIYIGNSHTGALRGVSNMESSKKIFNLSTGGQDLYHVKILLEKVVPETPKLKLIVIGLDYELLGYNYIVANQLWKDRLYYNYTGKLYRAGLGDMLMAKSNFYRANRNLSLLYSAKKTETKSKEKKGYEQQSFIPLQQQKLTMPACISRAKEHSRIKYDKSLIEENMSYLSKIVELCYKNDIKLVCINLPKIDCYETNYFDETIKLAQENYTPFLKNKNIKYIDLWNSEIFNKKDFIDADHLNSNGAQKVYDKYLKAL